MPEGDLTLYTGGRWHYREETTTGVLVAHCLHTGRCPRHSGRFHVHGRFTPADSDQPVREFVASEGHPYPADIMEVLRG